MGGRILARGKHRLTDRQVRNANKPGMLHDGAGLYLQILERPAKGDELAGVTKSWLLRYQAPSGKRREMGFGGLDKISLAAARDLAEAARGQAGRGIDPIEQRKADKAQAALDAAQALTFREAAEAYMKAARPNWKNAIHAAQWVSTLTDYVYPILGPLPVARIDTPLVLRVLEPIWNERRETARRVRGRIELILDWAAARGYRSRDNPARWKGVLDTAGLDAKRTVKHHAALPFDALPALMADLRAVEGVAARALEFTIQTAARTNETIGAEWSEIDLDEALWVVPETRMKAGKAHRVALSRQAVALLRMMRLANPKGRYVFPGPAAAGRGRKREAPLSNMAMAMCLRRLRENVTVHGFRSCFSDWSGERTNFARDVVEMALAHTIKNKVEAAYRRGDAFPKRRRLMQAWADFADRPATSGAVVNLKDKRASE